MIVLITGCVDWEGREEGFEGLDKRAGGSDEHTVSGPPFRPVREAILKMLGDTASRTPNFAIAKHEKKKKRMSLGS